MFENPGRWSATRATVLSRRAQYAPPLRRKPCLRFSPEPIFSMMEMRKLFQIDLLFVQRNDGAYCALRL